jgi:hydroxylamine reductase
MFCYQCQEAMKNEACKYKKGMCGKTQEVANLQDLLIFVLKGISIWAEKAKEFDLYTNEIGLFIERALFASITNSNFDSDRIIALIKEALNVREELKEKYLVAYQEKHGEEFDEDLPEAATWHAEDEEDFYEKAEPEEVGVLSTEDEDVRSLRELLIYGLKGISAYADHAAVLGFYNDEISDFLVEGLASTTKELPPEEMVKLVLKAGETAVKTMALLDEAHRSTYGNPEITEVNIGVGDNPGILISGHDMKDMHELLEQTKDTGVDVYTHCEMLPANYYPAFKKYDHFVGNYGSSWWHQNEEFDTFNGPILMTTNCIIPVKETYKDRMFTTGMAGYPEVKHIPDREEGGTKDFSELIELAKKCDPPTELETGKIVGGFAHNQVMALADKVVEAVKSGAIKQFIVMAGCDGRQKERQYFTEVAKELPEDAVILTAGCAKYRYNKLDLGDIGGIPRVLDAGQCNDSYSLAVIALKLKEVFELDDINDLPISFDVAWYEQKAVAVFLALLSLGFKGIRLGPTLPAFLSPNVAEVLVKNFDIKPTGEASADVEAMMAG